MRTELTDELILRLRDGDKTAFESLFHFLHPALLYLAGSYVSEEVAEEITADVFVKLWQRHSNFNSLASVRKFLYVVVRRDCVSAIRKQHTRDKALPQIPLTDTEYGATDFFREAEFIALSRLDKALQQLPPQQRAVIRLSFFERQKNDEIARQLGISINTVKTHKAKAIDNLRQHLSPEELSLLYCLIGFSYLA